MSNSYTLLVMLIAGFVSLHANPEKSPYLDLLQLYRTPRQPQDISSQSTVNKDLTVLGNLSVHGSAQLLDNARIGRDLEVENNLIIKKSVLINGEQVIGGNQIIVGNATIKNDLFVDNQAIVRNLEITEDALFLGNIDVANDLNVNGCITTSCLAITDSLSITDTLTVGCDVIVGCNIIMNDSLSPLIGNIVKNDTYFMHNFGTDNTFFGKASGNFVLTGSSNTAAGAGSMSSTTSGSNNIAIGAGAGSALTTGNNNICIGTSGITAEANTIRLGNNGTQTATFIAGVRNATMGTSDAVTVLIDSAGQLGTISSSKRFKSNVSALNITDISSRIQQIEPVSFHYNSDESQTKQFGLIAEQVESIFPELIIHDKDKQPLTIQYHLMPALLIAAIQHTTHQINDQAANYAELLTQHAILKSAHETLIDNFSALHSNHNALTRRVAQLEQLIKMLQTITSV